jgi:1-acylglycerone phosphate reductase
LADDKIGYVMPLLDTETSVAQKMFDVNVFGAIAVTRAFAPLLIASQGTIINNGSLAGKMPVPWQGYYNASKAAINHLTSQLRLELSPFGVNAICIVTGGIKTRFFENLPIKSLPPNSVYAAGEEELKIAFSGSYIYKDGSEADVYARAVVKNALKRSPKVNHWVGHSTFVGWFVDTFLWATFWVCMGQ